MSYTIDNIETKLDTYGELIVILDSGVEYELHKHTVTFEADNLDTHELLVEGMRDGEWVDIHINTKSIEHCYAHHEV